MTTEILVAYFPSSHHMRRSAENIAALSGGDLYAIRAVAPYSERPRSMKHEIKAERKGNIFPSLHGALPDLSGYRKIVLGFPLISGRCPNLVRSFLRQSDLRGKILYPYCITRFRRIGNCNEDLQSECNACLVLPCRNVDRMDQSTIRAWLEAGE